MAKELTLPNKVREWFRDNHSYINIAAIPDNVIIDFWEQDYIKRLPNSEMEFYCFRDYIISQSLTEIQK